MGMMLPSRVVQSGVLYRVEEGLLDYYRVGWALRHQIDNRKCWENR